MSIMAEMKAHPYTAGGIALVGLLALYFILRPSSTQTVSSAAQINAQNQGYNLQEQQLNSAAQLQAQQTNASLAASYANAQATNNQNIASVEAQYNNTDASLIAALATNQTQQQLNSIQGNAYTNQLTAELASTENTNATNLAAYNGTLNYQSGIAGLQAGLASQSLTDQTSLASESLQNNYNLSNSVLNMVGQAGLNHGTSSLETQLTALTSAALGQSNVGVAAEQAASSVGVASASNNPLNTLASQVGKVSSDAFSTLF